jgi:hypothetical protein
MSKGREFFFHYQELGVRATSQKCVMYDENQGGFYSFARVLDRVSHSRWFCSLGENFLSRTIDPRWQQRRRRRRFVCKGVFIVCLIIVQHTVCAKLAVPNDHCVYVQFRYDVRQETLHNGWHNVIVPHYDNKSKKETK